LQDTRHPDTSANAPPGRNYRDEQTRENHRGATLMYRRQPPLKRGDVAFGILAVASVWLYAANAGLPTRWIVYASIVSAGWVVLLSIRARKRTQQRKASSSSSGDIR
jgi:hypothetical protein